MNKLSFMYENKFKFMFNFKIRFYIFRYVFKEKNFYSRKWGNFKLSKKCNDPHSHGRSYVGGRGVTENGIRAKFSCHPVSQFYRQRHSFVSLFSYFVLCILVM